MTDLQHISVPLVDPTTGKATTVFYRYLRALQRDPSDVGDDEQPPLSETQVANLYSQVRDLMYTLDELVQKSGSFNKLEALYSQVQDIAYSVSELDQLIWSLRASSKKDFTYTPVVGGVHDAASYQFINAAKNATIKFPTSPRDGAEIIIRVSDTSTIKLDGRGGTINGSATGNLRGEETSIRFKFFVEAAGWFAI